MTIIFHANEANTQVRCCTETAYKILELMDLEKTPKGRLDLGEFECRLLHAWDNLDAFGYRYEKPPTITFEPNGAVTVTCPPSETKILQDCLNQLWSLFEESARMRGAAVNWS